MCMQCMCMYRSCACGCRRLDLHRWRHRRWRRWRRRHQPRRWWLRPRLLRPHWLVRQLVDGIADHVHQPSKEVRSPCTTARWRGGSRWGGQVFEHAAQAPRRRDPNWLLHKLRQARAEGEKCGIAFLPPNNTWKSIHTRPPNAHRLGATGASGPHPASCQRRSAAAAAPKLTLSGGPGGPAGGGPRQPRPSRAARRPAASASTSGSWRGSRCAAPGCARR